MKNKMKLYMGLLFIVMALVFSCSDMMSVYLNSDGGSAATDAAQAAEALTEDDFTFTGADSRTSVTDSFTLPVTGEVEGTTISWASDNTSVISISGGTATVTQPSGSNATVTLTATITDSEGNVITKVFEITVIALDITPGSFVADTFGMSASLVIPAGDFTTLPSGISQSLWASPNYLTTDGKKLFIGDYDARRILAYNNMPDSNGTLPDFVLGQDDFTSAFVGLTSSQMSETRGAHTNGIKFAVVEPINKRILIYNSIPNTTAQAADVVVGQNNFISNASNVSQTGMSSPSAVFLTDSKMIVSDNNRVLIYNSIPATNGAAADLVLGQADFTTNVSNSGGIGANTFQIASGLWSDGTRIIVCDMFNHRVLIWNSWPTSNNQAADLVLGQADFVSNAANRGSIGQNTLNRPTGVTVDGSDRIIIADSQNNRVVVYNTWPTTNGASPDAVLGQTNWTNNTELTTQSNFITPYGVLVDSTGNLWVSDSENCRVLRFTSN